jgi:hypothetical protein
MNIVLWLLGATALWIAFRFYKKSSALKRAQGAVGKTVALVSSVVDEAGEVSLRFMEGEFDLIDQEFFLKIAEQKALNIPRPLLVRLASNPVPDMFGGADYFLRVSEEEVKQFLVLDQAQLTPETPLH